MQASISVGSDCGAIEASASLEDDFDVIVRQHLRISHQGVAETQMQCSDTGVPPPSMVAGKVLGLHVVSRHNQTA